MREYRNTMIRETSVQLVSVLRHCCLLLNLVSWCICRRVSVNWDDWDVDHDMLQQVHENLLTFWPASMLPTCRHVFNQAIAPITSRGKTFWCTSQYKYPKLLTPHKVHHLHCQWRLAQEQVDSDLGRCRDDAIWVRKHGRWSELFEGQQVTVLWMTVDWVEWWHWRDQGISQQACKLAESCKFIAHWCILALQSWSWEALANGHWNACYSAWEWQEFETEEFLQLVKVNC